MISKKYQTELKKYRKIFRTYRRKFKMYQTILVFYVLPFVLLIVAIALAPGLFELLGYSIHGDKTITYSQAIDYTIQALLWSMGILLASKISEIKK